MICTKCGSPLSLQDKFCQKCGQPVALGVTTQTTTEHLANPFPLIIKIIMGVLILIIIAGILGSVLYKSSPDGGKLIFPFINIVLALVGMVSVFGIIVSVPLGIVFITKADGSTRGQEFRRLALYTFLTPICTVVAVIFCFTIVRVIENVITNTVTIN